MEIICIKVVKKYWRHAYQQAPKCRQRKGCLSRQDREIREPLAFSCSGCLQAAPGSRPPTRQPDSRTPFPAPSHSWDTEQRPPPARPAGPCCRRHRRSCKERVTPLRESSGANFPCFTHTFPRERVRPSMQKGRGKPSQASQGAPTQGTPPEGKTCDLFRNAILILTGNTAGSGADPPPSGFPAENGAHGAREGGCAATGVGEVEVKFDRWWPHLRREDSR